ncbi:hypothetical protein FIBSPDRAFT_939018 [Athelia psychrophila]|uniref:Uncharacterized protein n=1 Tax=Athelia psychrophila TaxID=1759441 RepID=A0A165XBU9_9AGAM|nr:hypothetical protein FIBSPDRAFT_939018 [Fibularhizoctonia sp. CBS 109695]
MSGTSARHSDMYNSTLYLDVLSAMRDVAMPRDAGLFLSDPVYRSIQPFRAHRANQISSKCASNLVLSSKLLLTPYTSIVITKTSAPPVLLVGLPWDHPPARKQGFIADLKLNDYDWVIFGFGVWGQPAHTVFYKDPRNTVKDPAPRAKLLFNSTVPPTLMPLGRRSR